ncbi:FAD-binding protein [Pseudaquabacterium rugosum]|uniref:FAD-binding protein n=1 Tax=Pseudaquabacterium rugosum TaxID=2984194 RepID=A0ABU9B4H6_9BURK
MNTAIAHGARVRRIDPRRPVVITPQGLRRIVLGSSVGERLGAQARSGETVKPLRLQGEPRGCLLVVAHSERGALDDAAREVVAAAALLAAPHEAVVLIAPCTVEGVDAPPPLADAAALGIDRVEQLPVPPGADAAALVVAVAARWRALSPRHTLLPDQGADADLGRRLAARLGLAAACGVREIAPAAEGRPALARVAWAGTAEGPGAGEAGKAGEAATALPALALLQRQVARTELPFVGRGEQALLQAPSRQPAAGLSDLGREAGRAAEVALEEAEFILAAGNGITDVALFQELAQALGAAVGASRVAVDDGRFTRAQQVGATGKTVQARGYLALGISGAVQHLQGIQAVRHVIAVNTDAAAPMMARAELGIVADAQPLMRALLALVRSPQESRA